MNFLKILLLLNLFFNPLRLRHLQSISVNELTQNNTISRLKNAFHRTTSDEDKSFWPRSKKNDRGLIKRGNRPNVRSERGVESVGSKRPAAADPPYYLRVTFWKMQDTTCLRTGSWKERAPVGIIRVKFMHRRYRVRPD